VTGGAVPLSQLVHDHRDDNISSWAKICSHLFKHISPHLSEIAVLR
jgi:hypothetical protein